jgi:hypothetical protein
MDFTHEEMKLLCEAVDVEVVMKKSHCHASKGWSKARKKHMLTLLQTDEMNHSPHCPGTRAPIH